MVKFNDIKDEVTDNLKAAIKDFIRDNNFNVDDVDVTPIDKDHKAILRIYSAKVINMREAEKTVYHGEGSDIFSFQCITRSSGLLEYDPVLTDEYMHKND